MPPPMRFGGGGNNNNNNNNNVNAHYAYPPHSQAHTGSLPLPSLAGNPNFISQSSLNNPFSMNGGNAMTLGAGFGASPNLAMSPATGLASHAAQMSFASASLQANHSTGVADGNARGAASKGRIREVWKGNLADEMAILRQLVDKYPYIAMDTEFPGLVARPMGAFRGKSDYHYQCLRCNVDLLKIIQLGITLFSEDGESPPPTALSTDSALETVGRRYPPGTQLPCTWQFNFKFSLKEDMYSEVSIEALKQAGVDFAKLDREGIDPFDFGALLVTSGLVCDEDVRWISFHGGYDFGYLTKVLICKPLPDDEVEFDRLMKKFFPSIYDIKYLLKQAIKDVSTGRLNLEPNAVDILNKFEQKAGLENLAEVLKVKRQGAAHQAGSDSLLTGKAFFKLKERIFRGDLGDDHLGKVWGLGFPDFQSQSNNHNNNAGQAAAAAQTQHGTPQHHHQLLQENTTPQSSTNNGGMTYPPKTPSTPNTGTGNHAGATSTPVAHVTNGLAGGGGAGPLTPGGQFGGGAFGSFQFGRQ